MKLRYNNTMEDLLAFSDFYYGQSPTMRRSLAQYRWGGAGAIFFFTFLLLAILGTVIDMPPVISLIIAALYASIFAVRAPKQYNKTLRKNVVKMYSESTNRRFLSEHELEVVADGLIERTPYNETKLSWGAVERIEATSEHTFIFVGPAMAYIIPNKRLTSGDLRDFLTTFQQNFTPDQPLQTSLAAPKAVAAPVIAPAEPIRVPAPQQPQETVAVAGNGRRWYIDP